MRKGDVATWVGSDVTPTLDMNLFIQRSEFRRATLAAGQDVPSPILNGVSPNAAWVSPPIGPSSPATLVLRASGDWGFNLRLQSPTTRYRLGLAFKAGSPQPARARVELVSAGGERETFHASFGEVSAEQLKASGGYRYVYFDMAEPPAQLRLTFLEARPGKSGDRRLQVTGVVLDEDTADYYDKIPQGR